MDHFSNKPSTNFSDDQDNFINNDSSSQTDTSEVQANSLVSAEQMMPEDSDDDGYNDYGGYNEYGERDRGYYYRDRGYERKTSPMMSPIISPSRVWFVKKNKRHIQSTPSANETQSRSLIVTDTELLAELTHQGLIVDEVHEVLSYDRKNQQKFSFADFKFKSILGERQSGKMLLCEFRGNMIALKSVDLLKAPSYVLEEMQKEVEIYKDLADIQGKYIPKLVCYGYYGGGMSFVIGLTIVGTMLSNHKITKRQRSRAIKGLEAIHKHGILHDDIWEENILINDNGDIYLIDFGMASREDTKKKRKLFDEEQLKLSQLLDRYIM
ncbi:kinase-like protein [Rhizophagus irregularis]|nr:kinase-like protein [Rhizophagus irregularis]